MGLCAVFEGKEKGRNIGMSCHSKELCRLHVKEEEIHITLIATVAITTWPPALYD